MSDVPDPMRAVRESTTWPQLQKAVAAWARARGIDPKAAVADLDGPSALSKLICAEAGVARPINKGGRPRRETRNRLILSIVDEFKRNGMKGKALWERAHFEIATNDSFMGLLESNEPSAIQRAYMRLNRKRRADTTSRGG